MGCVTRWSGCLSSFSEVNISKFILFLFADPHICKNHRKIHPCQTQTKKKHAKSLATVLDSLVIRTPPLWQRCSNQNQHDYCVADRQLQPFSKETPAVQDGHSSHSVCPFPEALMDFCGGLCDFSVESHTKTSLRSHRIHKSTKHLHFIDSSGDFFFFVTDMCVVVLYVLLRSKKYFF